MDGRVRLRAKYRRGCHQTSHVRWKRCHAEIVSGWSMQESACGAKQPYCRNTYVRVVRKRLIAHERFRNLADGVRNAMSPSVLQFVRELNTASAAVPCPSRCNSSSASYVLKQVEAGRL